MWSSYCRVYSVRDIQETKITLGNKINTKMIYKEQKQTEIYREIEGK